LANFCRVLTHDYAAFDFVQFCTDETATIVVQTFNLESDLVAEFVAHLEVRIFKFLNKRLRGAILEVQILMLKLALFYRQLHSFVRRRMLTSAAVLKSIVFVSSLTASVQNEQNPKSLA
jgi:hypothetical protein